MRARRHLRLYAAALHPVMRACVRRRRTGKCNCTVFYVLRAAFQMRTYGSREWTRILFCSANDHFHERIDTYLACENTSHF